MNRCVLSGLLLCVTLAAQADGSFEILSDVKLTGALAYAQDVRWLDQNRSTAAVALGPLGVAKVDISGTDIKVIERICDDNQASSCDAMVLSAGGGQILFSGWDYTLKWTHGSGPIQSLRHPRRFNAVLDHDVLKGRVIWAGGKYPKAGFCADGAVAWVASLTNSFEEEEAVHMASSGPGCAALDHCLGLFLPRVRFLPDGSYVVFPGVEDGLFHYQGKDELVRYWDNGALGIDIPCSYPENLRNTYFTNESLRHSQLLNKATLVDEILPAGPPIEAILRRVGDNGTVTWQLISLDESIDSEDLPISSGEATAHLRADIEDGVIVVVINGFPGNKPHGARLVVMRRSS